MSIQFGDGWGKSLQFWTTPCWSIFMFCHLKKTKAISRVAPIPGHSPIWDPSEALSMRPRVVVSPWHVQLGLREKESSSFRPRNQGIWTPCLATDWSELYRSHHIFCWIHGSLISGNTSWRSLCAASQLVQEWLGNVRTWLLPESDDSLTLW